MYSKSSDPHAPCDTAVCLLVVCPSASKKLKQPQVPPIASKLRQNCWGSSTFYINFIIYHIYILYLISVYFVVFVQLYVILWAMFHSFASCRIAKDGTFAFFCWGFQWLVSSIKSSWSWTNLLKPMNLHDSWKDQSNLGLFSRMHYAPSIWCADVCICNPWRLARPQFSTWRIRV